MLHAKVIDDAAKFLSSKTLSDANILTFPANFARIRYSDPVLSLQHQILLEHMAKSDRIVEDGSKTLVEMLLAKETAVQRSFSFFKPSCKSLLQELDRKFSIEIVDIVATAVALAGPTGKVVVEKSRSGKTGVELKIGAEFNVISPTGDFCYVDPYVVLVDGFLESANELEHLFVEASDSLCPVLLFCRGASEEVLHTISVNMKRGALHVRPIISKFDENGINTFRDVSAVTHSSVITSDMGSLISSASLKNSSVVKKATFSSGILSIEPKDAHSTANHVSKLLEKLDTADENFNFDLIRKRAVSLSARRAIIYIADCIDFPVLRLEIDRALKSFSQLVRDGICNEYEAYKQAALYAVYKSCNESLKSPVVQCFT